VVDEDVRQRALLRLYGGEGRSLICEDLVISEVALDEWERSTPTAALRPSGVESTTIRLEVRNRSRTLRTIAWATAALALMASASGWFAVVVGLPLGLLAMGASRIARSHGAFFMAAAAVIVAVVWLVLDRL
jgi:hypothetical protein